jgi:tRNA-specific 2-thiouridylase
MRVVVAMSGGVDSSVVAGLLTEAGHEVIGVHMKLHDGPDRGAVASERRCCGLDDALDARRVADTLGIPFYVMDLKEAFQRSVIQPFTDAWIQGATPNPCVLCNAVLKFQVLLARARALGAEALATGHYARIDQDFGLSEAADPDKDQSYFLFPMSAEARRRTLFPLGGMTKPQVRAEAARLGLVTASKPDSQEVCFIPDDDHAGFVSRQAPDLEAAGEIRHVDGRLLGQHEAYYRFTVGQRRGLGVATGEPLYVLSINPTSRQVIVGPDNLLRSTEILARSFVWHRPIEGQLEARIRHRGARIPAEVAVEGDLVRVRFRAPARAATRGQAVVLYSNSQVVGGGWIQEILA